MAQLELATRVAEAKTKLTGVNPTTFINQIDERRRSDCRELIALMRDATGQPAKMWGAIVGFDSYRVKYANGKEADWPLTGFSPRKQDLVLYLGPGLENKQLLAKLGKHKTGKGCLYLKRLDDVDRTVLRALIEASVRAMRSRRS